MTLILDIRIPPGTIFSEFIRVLIGDITGSINSRNKVKISTCSRIIILSEESNDFIQSYLDSIDLALNLALKRNIRLRFTGNDKKPINRWLSKLLEITRSQEDIKDLSTWEMVTKGLELYKNYLEDKEPESIISEILNEFQNCSILEGSIIAKYGNFASPQIFKANFYANQRNPGYKNADIRLGIHTMTMAFVGALLSKAGELREKNEKKGIYLLMPEDLRIPNLLRIFELYRETIGRVQVLTPEILFKLYMCLKSIEDGLELRILDLSYKFKVLTMIEPGNRATVLDVIELDLSAYAKALHDLFIKKRRSFKTLKRIVETSLKKWRPAGTRNKEDRIIAEIGYKLALLYDLALNGAMEPSQFIYELSRITYANVSADVSKALAKFKLEPADVMKMLKDLGVTIYEQTTRYT